ncbi:MAG: hypothetical protein ACYC9K_00870 [Sulfuricaulis sp.]
MKQFFIGMTVGVLIALSGVGAWQYHTSQVTAVSGGAPKLLAAEAKSPVPCKSILVYPQKAKQQLKLPPDVVADVAQQVVASTTTPGDEHTHTVTAVTDLGTGDTQMLVREEPLPWFSTQRKAHLSLAYGFNGLHPVMQVEATEDFFHFKALNFGATGRVQTVGTPFVGLTASMDW